MISFLNNIIDSAAQYLKGNETGYGFRRPNHLFLFQCFSQFFLTPLKKKKTRQNVTEARKVKRNSVIHKSLYGYLLLAVY